MKSIHGKKREGNSTVTTDTTENAKSKMRTFQAKTRTGQENHNKTNKYFRRISSKSQKAIVTIHLLSPLVCPKKPLTNRFAHSFEMKFNEHL